MRQPFGAQLTAGDTWSWTGLDLSDLGYSPTTHTLKYAFRGSEKLDLVAVASASAGGYDVTADAAATAKLSPGVFGWVAAVFAIADNARTEIARGTVTIVADIFAADVKDSALDFRSWVKASLDAVQAVLQGRASRVESEYQISGRMLRLLTPKELLDLEGELSRRYQSELQASGQLSSSSNQILARFCQ
jgi:hypothetical protein